MADNKKKIKIDNILGTALKSALSRTLGATPVGIGAGIAVDVVKSIGKDNKPVVEEKSVETIKNDIVTQLSKDPVILNQMNMENPVLSRTGQGGFAATVIAAWMLYKFGWQVPVDQWDINIVGSALMTFMAGFWVLWGRFKTGLPPAFTWAKNLVGKSKG